MRYLEIAHILKSKIRQGIFPYGQMLPSQKDLARTFNTSLMTIRGALAELEQEGVISVVHGVGTFVADSGIHADSIGLQGFQNEIDRQKKSIANKILSVKHNILDSRLDQLFSRQHSTYSCLTRLRTIDTIAVILQHSYVESSYKEILDTYDEHDSLYQHFSHKMGVLITQGKEIVMPIILEPNELQILKLTPPATAFLSKRISISIDDQVILYDEAYLAGSYVFMASRKLGKNNVFKYIINKSGTIDAIDSFSDPELWEDLI